jgi:hypothetical protein
MDAIEADQFRPAQHLGEASAHMRRLAFDLWEFEGGNVGSLLPTALAERFVHPLHAREGSEPVRPPRRAAALNIA